MPSGEWDWDQYWPYVSFVGDDPEEFLVGIDVRPGAFERDRGRQRRLQPYCDRRRYIFAIAVPPRIKLPRSSRACQA
jgi:hypothetical protein